ncbi:MAG: AbrB/MazE/SpoVT family DNA-binding domain-containing protein [Deltaproteobacteria bacterium]|nr:AbrB/MazE/SpoVT family DNA-binding domain-containing protein [Deltaproteobacteria bacterium]
MSSKGQVVIPETVRNELGLKTGSQFVVLGRGGDRRSPGLSLRVVLDTPSRTTASWRSGS